MADAGGPPLVPKLPWLRRLRWTAVVGQTLAVWGVHGGLGVPLPVGAVLGVIAATAVTNLVLHGVSPDMGERPRFLAGVLALDVGLLTLLLRLTGGPYNPFATLYLVLVALAAVALTPWLTAGIAGLACVGYGGLYLAPEWLVRPGDPICGVGPNLPLDLHLRGMLVAFAVTAGLVAYFAGRLQHLLRRRDTELAAARERAHQHERFAALATLAAGAAHELGTPLGTIVVAAGELAREARQRPGDGALRDDAELIRREAFRCRAILDRLQNQAEDRPREMEVAPLLEELRERFPQVQFAEELSVQPTRLVAPPEALAQALTNLIDNAVHASPDNLPVRVDVRATEARVEFLITDRGMGVKAEVLAHAGEPFFTTKPAGRGMGLGLFLVRLLARRLAGEFRFETPVDGGTRAVLSLPSVVGGLPR